MGGCAMLLSMSRTHYRDPAISMAAVPSAMTRLQPTRAGQFMKPVTMRLQPLLASTSPKEASPMTNVESQIKPTSVLAKQEARRELIGKLAVALGGAALAKDRAAVASEMKKGNTPVGDIGSVIWNDESPLIVKAGWAFCATMYSTSIALVIWGRGGL